MSASPEIVIIGAGVAGAAMATVLARSGHEVLVLERSVVHEDRIRGESIPPWGVDELRRLGLLDVLIEAGGHFATRLVLYGEGIDPAVAEARAIDLTTLFPGVGGTLKIGHPRMCQALDDAAEAAGAKLLRGVSRLQVRPGRPPTVRFVHDGIAHEGTPRLVIGADGRGSFVAAPGRIEVATDPEHHLFAGLLVDGVEAWPQDQYSIGTEEDGTYYIFPQGPARPRLYYAYHPSRRRAFAGPDAAANLIRAFKLNSVPNSKMFAAARPAGPCQGYPNADCWADRPMAPGVVLIGDAAAVI